MKGCKMTILKELKPCPKCGSIAEMKSSFGGFDVYYGIYCTNEKCGHNNRTHNSAIFAHGLGSAGGFPPTDRDVAISEWNSQIIAVESVGGV
jgi:hypothetical protein